MGLPEHVSSQDIHDLCRWALREEGNVSALFDYVITALGKLTGVDYWAEED